MMNTIWPFMGGFGMIFMLVISGFVAVIRWIFGNTNRKQCNCNQTSMTNKIAADTDNQT